VLLEAGAIRECEEHGWMRERADPHARERALLVARQDSPSGTSPDEAAAAVADVLESIGDTCPECPPDIFFEKSERTGVSQRKGPLRVRKLTSTPSLLFCPQSSSMDRLLTSVHLTGQSNHPYTIHVDVYWMV